MRLAFSIRRRFFRFLYRNKLRCILFTILLLLYIKVNLKHYGLYTGNHPFFAAQPCEYLDEKQRDQLINMTSIVHKILDGFGIEHWLMYGSVFGALRNKGPLSWDNDVDIGFRGSGTFASMTFDEFIKPFAAKGLKIYYKRWITSNVMKVYSEDLPHIKVDLFAFYDYNGWMKRAGLETWIFALNYNLHDTFPTVLVEKPLPDVPFGGITMPAPREGIEIQRYLYPDDWWMEVKPITCEQ